MNLLLNLREFYKTKTMTVKKLFEKVHETFPPMNDETKNKDWSIIQRINLYNERFIRLINKVPNEDWCNHFHTTKEEILLKIKCIFEDIQTIIQGNLSENNNNWNKSREIISNYFFNRDNEKFLESKISLRPSNLFFRIRRCDNEWKGFTQTSLFHISKNKSIETNYRYSCSKRSKHPVLYLASSPYLALIECQLEKFDTDFCIAGYLFNEKVKVLNLSYSDIESPTLNYLYKIPFIYSSSLVVTNENQRHEYILPQLIMDAFIENNCNLMFRGNIERFDGICYQSVHSKNGSMYNIAFPALECDPIDGYCNNLAQLFKITAPLYIETKSLKYRSFDLIIKEQIIYMPKDFIRNGLKDIRPQSIINLNEYEIQRFDKAAEYLFPEFNLEKWCLQYWGIKRDKEIGDRYTKFDIETIRIKLLQLRIELETINSLQTLKSLKEKYPNIITINNTEELNALKYKIRRIIIRYH